MYYQAPTPMMPLAHAMNNPLQVQQAVNIRKPDFPPDMQPIFVIPQIAHTLVLFLKFNFLDQINILKQIKTIQVYKILIKTQMQGI